MMPVLYVKPFDVVDWPDDGSDPDPLLDVGELPDDPVVGDPLVEDGVNAVAHSVRYCTVTPSPFAVMPVVREPPPNPDHFWFDWVKVALYARNSQTSFR